MLTTQQIFNKIFRNDQGEPPAEILLIQQVFNRIFDESKNALRISGAFGLLKTGQKIQYDGKPDDGYYEKGINHDYEILTTGNQSGTTAIVINGKTHNLSNNIVRDYAAKIDGKPLDWARYVPNADIGPAADGRLFWRQWTLANKTDISFDAATKVINSVAGAFSTSALCIGRKATISGAGVGGNNQVVTVAAITANNFTTVEEIFDEAAGASISFVTLDDLIWNFLGQANANSLGGYNDWRIPNYRELPSIVDLGHCNPAIDTTVFPSTPSTYHWAASTYPCSSTNAFSVYFGYGDVSGRSKEPYKYYVRLVRG
jgi:hypothetical protein